MAVFASRRSLGGLLLGTLAVLAAACGGASTPPPPPGQTLVPGTGSFILLGKDQPLDNLLKFEITLTSVVLNPGNVSVLPQPVRLELTSLQMTQELVRLAQNIPPGTYTSVTLTFANPEIKFCPDPPAACDNPIEVQPPLQTTSVTVNVTFGIASGQLTGVLLDFNLASSVVTDPITGNITAINPVVTATVLNITGLAGEFEDEVGRVISVSVNPTSPTSGTFVFEPFSSCQQVTITVNSATEFEDFNEAIPPLANSFSSVQPGQILEVDADIRGDGTFLAEEVGLEEQDEAVDDEAEGLIVAVTRDPGTNEVTQFQMVLFDVAPCPATLPAQDLITVNVPASGVQFRIDDDGFVVNTNLFNDRTDLDVGQKVDVDATVAFTTSTTSITAEKIKLEDQTIRGTVIAGSIAPPSFSLDPNAALFPDQSITVQTVTGQTRFDDLPNGVASLVSNQAVRVKGLLFRLGAGEQSMLAKRVDGTP